MVHPSFELSKDYLHKQNKKRAVIFSFEFPSNLTNQIIAPISITLFTMFVITHIVSVKYVTGLVHAEYSTDTDSFLHRTKYILKGRLYKLQNYVGKINKICFITNLRWQHNEATFSFPNIISQTIEIYHLFYHSNYLLHNLDPSNLPYKNTDHLYVDTFYSQARRPGNSFYHNTHVCKL